MVVILFLSLFGLTNYYIGLKIYNYLALLIPALNSTVYWILFLIIALSIFVGRVNKKIIPTVIKNLFNLVGSFWIGVMCYALLLFLLIDLISLVFSYLNLPGIINLHIPNFNLYWQTLLLLFIIGIIVYGTSHGRKLKVNSFDIIIPKNSAVTNLNLVFLSDIHLAI